MRKYVKLVSALLILVMMMAQVVCLNAATAKATTSYSAKQTDHIAGRLIEITGSPRKAWDVILGAYSSDKVLTFSKWEAFLNEWDSFKDMPSDLAVYLV